MILDIFGHCVARISHITEVGLGDIVRELGLIEIRVAIFTTPYSQVFKSVFGSKSVTIDIVTIDDQAIVDRVLAIDYETPHIMISPPKPHVIDNSFIIVDNNK